ncbi:hypothetical protein OPIT5_10665 [Opitutaceae bacterium TAV5]|nr:hypothetical protein OPIT5_10665 [Opitutaceae bacterium TAV5]
MQDDEARHSDERFIRIRRVKRLLRFMPRRARLHKYPFIGRFAASARKRGYLWSFKSAQVRPALYLGCVVNFLPILGAQIPIALILAIVFRLNFMVMGGLQIITNPLTAVPSYSLTYLVGMAVIDATGSGHNTSVVENVDLPAPIRVADEIALDRERKSGPEDTTRGRPTLGTRIAALVIGGVLVGAATGGLLDLAWRFGSRQAARHRRSKPRPQPPTPDTPPLP